MVDYGELKRKFKPKRPPVDKPGVGPLHRKSSRESVRRVEREYELKRAQLGGGVPSFRRGPIFYGFVMLGLALLGSIILTRQEGGLTLGKKRIDRAALQARKSMDALSVALGRYKFHVGDYPTTEEGLEALAARTSRRQGWDGPYVNHIVNDPWGRPYVYERRAEGGHPVLYSCGADGRAGTTDDVMPDQASFDAPFRDTTWTNGWAPYRLRGIVVAPDEATKRRVQEEMKRYDAPTGK